MGMGQSIVARILAPGPTALDLPDDAPRALRMLALAAGVTTAPPAPPPPAPAARITRIAGFRITLKLRQTYVSAMYITPTQQRALLRVTLADGTEGWGECPAAAAGAMPAAARAFMGADIANGMEAARARFARIGFDNRDGRNGWAAIAAVEAAAWDALARTRNLPLAALFGGATRPLPIACPLPAAIMAADATRADLPPHMADHSNTARLAEHAQEIAARSGARAFKYKSAGCDPAWDIACMTALRRAFPEAALRFDPNAAYSTRDALNIGAALRELAPEFLEDPCDGIEGLARITAALPGMRVASNMAVIEPSHLLAAHRRGLQLTVLGDAFLWGGLQGLADMAGMARLLGLTPAVHSFYESAVATAASAHLAAALDMDAPHAVDCGVPGLADDITDDAPEVRNGMLHTPAGPGIAVTPTRPPEPFFTLEA